MTIDFMERFKEENRKNSINIKVFIGLFVVCFIIFMASGCTNNNEDITDIEIPEEQVEIQSEVKVGNDGVNAAIAPDEAPEATATVTIDDFGRSDPFLPITQQVAVNNNEQVRKPNIDLLPPPEIITVDPVATELLTTKVSGIMYDKLNPSAILNISGSDYLVRTGDVINNYKILSIGKENVIVQSGANVYKAGVGEMFTGDGINYNTVSDLEHKFGGRKNLVNKR